MSGPAPAAKLVFVFDVYCVYVYNIESSVCLCVASCNELHLRGLPLVCTTSKLPLFAPHPYFMLTLLLHALRGGGVRDGRGH